MECHDLSGPRPTPLRILDALERRYDGPLPPPLRDAALSGSADLALLYRARSETAFFSRLLLGEIEALRAGAKPNGSPGDCGDFAYYRRSRRAWRRLAHAIEGRQREAPPNEGRGF
jgi:hypothetical protein